MNHEPRSLGSLRRSLVYLVGALALAVAVVTGVVVQGRASDLSSDGQPHVRVEETAGWGGDARASFLLRGGFLGGR